MANSNIDHAFTARDKTGASLEPTYAGALSFMRRKYSKDVKGADAVVWGIPFDAAVTNRPGARFGPQAIRRAAAILDNDPQYPFARDLLRLAQPPAIVAGNDETRQDEEEVDEQIGRSDESALRKCRTGRKMQQRHQKRADAAPGIQNAEAFAGNGRRPAFCRRQGLDQKRRLRHPGSHPVSGASAEACPDPFPHCHAEPVPGRNPCTFTSGLSADLPLVLLLKRFCFYTRLSGRIR